MFTEFKYQVYFWPKNPSKTVIHNSILTVFYSCDLVLSDIFQSIQQHFRVCKIFQNRQNTFKCHLETYFVEKFPELLKNFYFSECCNWETFSFIFHQNFFQSYNSIALNASCFPNFPKSTLTNFCHALVFCRFVWTIFKSAFQIATALSATLVRI